MSKPSQNDRVLAVLIANGAKGTYVDDWDRGPDRPACDGGPRVTRLHARIRDLRQAGHGIVEGPPRGRFKSYVLIHLAHAQAVRPTRHPGGWIETHYCRRCDFPGERPCGPVCPTCGQPAVHTLDLDLRPTHAGRLAA